MNESNKRTYSMVARNITSSSSVKDVMSILKSSNSTQLSPESNKVKTYVSEIIDSIHNNSENYDQTGQRLKATITTKSLPVMSLVDSTVQRFEFNDSKSKRIQVLEDNVNNLQEQINKQQEQINKQQEQINKQQEQINKQQEQTNKQSMNSKFRSSE
jgi:chromosome segregation ATPase